jgi:hypothetical protein
MSIMTMLVGWLGNCLRPETLWFYKFRQYPWHSTLFTMEFRTAFTQVMGQTRVEYEILVWA